MKPASILALSLSLITVSFAQDDIARMQVKKVSADYVRAVETGDVQTLKTLQSPDMVYIAANDRRMTREEVFRALRADLGKWSLHNTSIEACQVFGDIVVTTGTEEVRAESGTSTLRRFTNVWQRSGSDWVMISRTVAILRTQTAVVR